MQVVKITFDRNTNINFGAEMKRKHFTLLHMWLLFYVRTRHVGLTGFFHQ